MPSPLPRHPTRIAAWATLAWFAGLAGCGGGDVAEPTAATPSAATRLAALPTPPADTTRASTLPSTLPSTRSTIQAAASSLDTTGIDALFRQIGVAMASPVTCAGPGGMAATLASKAHLETPRTSFNGATQVAAALCAWLADDSLWGATLAAPNPTRCSQRDGAASCRVSFELLAADGSVRRLARQLAVTREAGVWKLLGHVDPMNITAFASAQRERRLDSGVTVDRYTRGLVLSIPAAAGLACARVSQTDASGQRSTLAYFKPYDGLGVKRLSLWRTGPAADKPRSTNALSGDLRIVDDVYLALPEGSAGDTVVNNLVRDGGSVRISLHADAACSTPFGSSGSSGSNEFDVSVDGTPPLAATQAVQAWPQLTPTAAGDLRRLGLNSLAGATLNTGWTGTASGFRPELAMLCVDDAHCAAGDDGRIGERSLARSASVTTLTLKNRKQPVVPADFKLLSLSGRNPGGLVMLADFQTCASTAAGKPCPSDP